MRSIHTPASAERPKTNARPQLRPTTEATNITIAPMTVTDSHQLCLIVSTSGVFVPGLASRHVMVASRKMFHCKTWPRPYGLSRLVAECPLPDCPGCTHDAPSLFSHGKNRKARGEKRALTLLALNPHRVSRDQPLCCRRFRRNGPGLGYRPSLSFLRCLHPESCHSASRK